ncbi:MAG: hypothetical protein R3346_04015 [Candidatus Spechtbacterales bacterium]|nr:hypothetical protein [Candidatus Spechtbacterales bacterium]
MSIEKPTFEQDKNKLETLANNLDELQASENEGRGISCVRTIAAYLRAGDKKTARAICLNESDKIRSYPEIYGLLKEQLVEEDF